MQAGRGGERALSFMQFDIPHFKGLKREQPGSSSRRNRERKNRNRHPIRLSIQACAALLHGDSGKYSAASKCSGETAPPHRLTPYALRQAAVFRGAATRGRRAMAGVDLPSWVTTRSPGPSVSMARSPSGVAIRVPVAKQLKTCAKVSMNPVEAPPPVKGARSNASF